MALRSNYSSLDMIRMAKFAKANPDLKPIPLIQEYNKKYPEISEAQKRENIRNWLNDNELIDKIENETCVGKPEYLKSGNCNIADVSNNEADCKYKESCGHDLCNLIECDEYEPKVSEVAVCQCSIPATTFENTNFCVKCNRLIDWQTDC